MAVRNILPTLFSSNSTKVLKMSMTNDEAAARLKPFKDDYMKTFAAGKTQEMARFYHKNAVLVETDKSVVHGPEAIIKEFEKAEAIVGKSQFTVQNVKYEGVGDFINLEADFEQTTEKVGNLRGHFLQIWRKDGNGYTVYHDEFQVL